MAQASARLAPIVALLWGGAGACAKRRANVPGTVEIPGGAFTMGSSLDERAAATDLAVATGRVSPSQAVRRAKTEYRQAPVKVRAFQIMARPVTHADYLHFVRATGAPEPYLDRMSWQQRDRPIGYEAASRELWSRGVPRPDRANHPVVFVSRPEAQAYCGWWAQRYGRSGRLPSEAQWEKAARGTDGRRYPWGDAFDPVVLNAAESELGGASPVGGHPEGASPYGVLDMAGNVFEWTRTSGIERESAVVKGGSWLSDGGSARAAARHERPIWERHIAVGFRCIVE